MGPWLFLAVVLLLFQALPFSTQEEHSREGNATCPANFTCGNMSLMFPFTHLQRYNCGLCVLDCTAKPSPRIALGYPPPQWFRAESIEDSNSTMTLYSEILHSLLANQSCLSFYYEISLPNSPISFNMLHNITLFRCHNNSDTNQRIHKSFPGFGYYGGCNERIFYQKNPYSGPPAGSIDPLCSAVYLPYNKSFSPDNKSDDDHVPEVFRLLGSEFDLQWRLSDDCYDCRRRGGVCQTDWSNKTRCVNAGNSPVAGKKRFHAILLIAAVSGGLGLLICFLLCKFKKLWSGGSTLILGMKKRKEHNLETFIRECGSLAPKCYSYSDIKKMANSFKDELGKGGYGTVYKGKLSDGHFVAVKILNATNENEEDFVNEVLSIGRTSHVNVVKLLGFCFQGKRRALIYEFMPNGSLEKYIHSQKNSYPHLGMDKLYEISLGVARGLEYLHRGCNTRILHFDIKPHNILLDEDFCPKISDFGMAKQCTNKQSGVSILEARGTIGYIAPELISRCFGVVSYKSDVYSYGMMILEIVGRRKNVSLETSHASEIFFPRWAYQHLIIDKDLQLKGVVSSEEDEIAKKIIQVGLWCIQKDPSQRPTMSKVIEMLEGDLQALEIPPKPFFDSPSSSPLSSLFYDVSEFSPSTVLN